MELIFNICAAMILTAVAGQPPGGVKLKDAEPRQTKRENAFSNVAELALALGQDGTMHVRLAREFGLPQAESSRVYREVSIPQAEEGRVRALQVRRRPGTDQIDIVMVDTTRDQGGYFYLVSPEGRVLRAIHAKGRLVQLSDDDAAMRFAAELAYWQQWERDRNR